MFDWGGGAEKSDMTKLVFSLTTPSYQVKDSARCSIIPKESRPYLNSISSGALKKRERRKGRKVEKKKKVGYGSRGYVIYHGCGMRVREQVHIE